MIFSKPKLTTVQLYWGGIILAYHVKKDQRALHENVSRTKAPSEELHLRLIILIVEKCHNATKLNGEWT